MPILQTVSLWPVMYLIAMTSSLSGDPLPEITHRMHEGYGPWRNQSPYIDGFDSTVATPPSALHNEAEVVTRFAHTLLSESKNLDPDIARIVKENFLNLL